MGESIPKRSEALRIPSAATERYLGDVPVPDACCQPALGFLDSGTGFDHKQPLVQSDDALPVHALDDEPDTLPLVHITLQERLYPPVGFPRLCWFRHLSTSSTYRRCISQRRILSKAL